MCISLFKAVIERYFVQNIIAMYKPQNKAQFTLSGSFSLRILKISLLMKHPLDIKETAPIIFRAPLRVCLQRSVLISFGK